MSQTYPFERFSHVYSHQGNFVFAGEGGDIFYISNRSGQYNIWRQRIDAPAREAVQLTTYTEDTPRLLAESPDGKSLLFMMDHHGNECHQLYLVSNEGGAVRRLTTNDEARHLIGTHPFSPDGASITFASNVENPAAMDIFRLHLGTGKRETLFAENLVVFPFAWSPDGRRLLLTSMQMNTDTDIHLFDLDTGRVRNLTAHSGEAVHFPVMWAGDGSGFYLISDRERDFKALAFFDLTTETIRWIETPDWDVEQADLAGDHLAWTVNEGGYSRLYVRDLKRNRCLELPDLPKGVIEDLTFDPSGKRLGFLFSSGREVRNLHLLDLSSGTLTKLTANDAHGIPLEIMVEPQLVSFLSADGRRIPAFLYRPHSPSDNLPVLVSIHGGPEMQERPQYNYSGLYQYLLHRGIAVLAPNIRGSTGYGKTYQKLIHHDWGGAELRDIEAAAKFLQGLDWVDPERIGIFGGSFGGFATLSALTRLPDYWACGVDLVGPSNLVTFVKSVPPFWKRFMDTWVGDPETELAFLQERSPIHYVDRIRAPLFILQGANDPRVVKAESDQIVEKLRKRGIPVRYDVYEDEGHGFTKRENLLKALGDIAHFLEEHLLG